MDLGRILDGTPEPPTIIPNFDLFTNGTLHPADTNVLRDYVLPVPMTPFQKQLTDDVVSLHYSDILNFYETGSLENQVLQHSMEHLYANTQLVATHPYLLVQHYLPPNLLLKDVPNKLAKESGKFQILVDFIELVRDKKMDIALVSRAGKSFDLIEALLLGKMINYKRYSGSYLRQNSKTYKKFSTIHLFPSSQLDSTYIGSERFDLVIAFDLSFDLADPHIKAVRTQSRPVGSPPAPVIRFIPYYSAEHIIYKFQELKTQDETLFMKRVVAAIVILRGRAGSLPVDLRPYYSLGMKFLLPWLSDPTNNHWPLPATPEIDIYSAEDVEKSLLTEVVLEPSRHLEDSMQEYSNNISETAKTSNGHAKSNGHTNHHHNGLSFPKSVLKYEEEHDLSHPNIHRSICKESTDDDDFYQAKRLKREKYSPSAPETALSFLAPPEGSSPVKHTLTHKLIRRLDIAMRELSLKDTEIASHRAIAASRQNQYEELLEDSGKLTHEINQLKEKLRVYERKSERYDSDIQKLNETITKQTDELEQAHKLIKSESPATTIQLDEQNKEMNTVKESLQKAEEKIKSLHYENDYIRSEYQQASSAATNSLNDVVDLKKENEALKAKLEIAMQNMRQLSFDEERKAFENKIKELTVKNKNLEQHMKRLIENERLNSTRSRYGIRNSNSSRRNNSPSISGGRRGSPATS